MFGILRTAKGLVSLVSACGNLIPFAHIASSVLHDGFNHFYLPEPYQRFGGSDEKRVWLRGPHDEMLLYIPEEYRPYLQHPPCALRIAEKRLTINWEGAVHGEDWTKCYIGPEFIVREPEEDDDSAVQ